MKNISASISVCLLLLALISTSVVLAQPFRIREVAARSAINRALDEEFSRRFEVRDVRDIDSSAGRQFDSFEPAENPYGSLNNCFVFTTRTKKGQPPAKNLVGVFRNNAIVWHSDTVIWTWGGGYARFFTSRDLNSDGEVELIIMLDDGARGDLWIFSWDGTSGRQMNSVDDHGKSVIEGKSDAMGFVDVEGDGVWEIIDFDVSDGSKMWSWNGQQYGRWSTTPQAPITTTWPRDKVDPILKVVTTHTQGVLAFSYVLQNKPTSKQRIVLFSLASHSALANSTSSPIGWNAMKLVWRTRVFDTRGHIFPGMSLSGFRASGEVLPAVLQFVVQGYNALPDLNDSDPTGSLETVMSGMRQNNVKGITVGPADPPNPFIPVAFLDTLSSHTTQSRTLGWITSQQIADKYLGSFASARTALQVNNISAVQSTLNQVLSDVNVDSSSTLTSEAYALIRFNTEYLLAHLPSSGGGFPYALFATHSMHLEQGSDVSSGDIGVNEAGSPPFLDSQVELSIGISTSIAPGCSVKANRIKVKQGATVAGEVFYNQLENNGTITGAQHSPLTLPSSSTFPEFKTPSPGTQDLTIAQNGSQTLQPGSYKDILVRKNGTLTFTGGVYHLSSLNTGDNVKLLFQGPSEVRIAGKFDTDQGTYTGPQDTTSLSANQIIFYIAGINGSNGNLGATPKAAQIGIANTVKANFYVPNGTLWVRQNSKATGAFIGKDVDVGIGVQIRHQSAF